MNIWMERFIIRQEINVIKT